MSPWNYRVSLFHYLQGPWSFENNNGCDQCSKEDLRSRHKTGQIDSPNCRPVSRVVHQERFAGVPPKNCFILPSNEHNFQSKSWCAEYQWGAHCFWGENQKNMWLHAVKPVLNGNLPLSKTVPDPKCIILLTFLTQKIKRESKSKMENSLLEYLLDWGFCSGEDVDCGCVGCDAMYYFMHFPAFLRNCCW